MTPANILIVEDEAITSMHLQNSLRRLGYAVVGVTDSGDDAVRMAAERCPDLVLMDIGLRGELDGISAASRIHSVCHLPVVFLTAHADKATLERAKQSQPFGYLTKPFQESSLQATVEMALNKFKMEHLLRESEARYHAVVDQIADGVLLVELNTLKILDANTAVQDMLNLPTGGYADLALESVLPGSPDEFVDLARRVARYGQFQMGERQFRRKDGTLLDVDLRASLVHYSQQEVLCIVLHDITDIKRADKDLLRSYEQLRVRLSEIEELHTELRESAIRDPLTGLFNRRYLYELIQIEISRAAREGYAISFVMVDIDFFKDINDTYGHSAGDRLLQAIGAKLRNFCRLDDLVFRFGGDEFLLVLYKTTLDEAQKRTEQLLVEVEQVRIQFEEHTLNVTISAGIATYANNNQSIDVMIRQADQALYRAKATGRNCVIG